jgi:hypothetical protein
MVDLRVRRETSELCFDRRHDPGDFFRAPLEVFRRKDPERYRRNAKVNTPFEQVVELVGARHICVLRGRQTLTLAITSIAVKDQANMVRHRKRPDLPKQPMFIKPI